MQLNPPRTLAALLSATLVVTVAGIELSAEPAAAAQSGWSHTVTRVRAASDTSVSRESPRWSPGSSRKLVVRNTALVHKKSYLKFVVPQSLLRNNGQIESVSLVLTSRGSARSDVFVRRANSSAWSEATMNFNTAPGAGSTVAALVHQRGGLNRANVTSMVRSTGTYTFQLRTHPGVSRFYSSEAASNVPKLRVTVKRPQSTTTSCQRAYPGDQCGKVRYGAAVEGGDPAAFEASIGSNLSLYRSYMTGSTATSKFVSVATRDLSKGEIPLISTKLPDTWAHVAAGAQDAWLLERIRALAKVNGTVWLSLHHEPTGDGAPADWIKMQQHARKLIKANSTNIALVGILNGWDFLQNNPHPEVWNMPVGTGVDIMGFDSYNLWSPTNGKTWQPASHVLSPAVTIAGWGYPTVVGEYGVRNDPANPGKAAQWMKDAYAYAVAHKFAGMAYFHSGQNSPDGTWALSGERIPAFTTSLNTSKTQ